MSKHGAGAGSSKVSLHSGLGSLRAPLRHRLLAQAQHDVRSVSALLSSWRRHSAEAGARASRLNSVQFRRQGLCAAWRTCLLAQIQHVVRLGQANAWSATAQ